MGEQRTMDEHSGESVRPVSSEKEANIKGANISEREKDQQAESRKRDDAAGQSADTAEQEEAPEENQPTGVRRRGKVLEDAILKAAWDELQDVGYLHFTMEGVAERAKTNKTAVYRRWPGKPELVMAAMRRYLPRLPRGDDVPDTGSLRDDLVTLLFQLTQPIRLIGAETIHGLMVERLGTDFLGALPRARHAAGWETIWLPLMTKMLENARRRGEIGQQEIPPRAALLPLELVLYEFLTTFEPISKETIAEIVDDIFLPLLRGL